MPMESTNFEKSERSILDVLNRHKGTMGIDELLANVRKAHGDLDETLLRAALWHLISQARIERNADTISVSKARHSGAANL